MSFKLSRAPKWALFVAPIVLMAVAAKRFNQDPPVNSAQTASDASDVALRTRIIRAPWSEVVRAAQAAIGAQKTYGRAWKIGQSSIVGAKPGTRLRQELHVEVPVVVFTDDLSVTISEEEDGQIRLDCASKARIGRGDFGENRRHVLQFLGAFDQEIKTRI